MGFINKRSDNVEVKNYEKDYGECQDGIESPRIILEVEQRTDSKRKPLNQQPAYDRLVSAELMSHSNVKLEKGNVMGRYVILEGVIIDSYHEHLKLNSIVRDIELSDG